MTLRIAITPGEPAGIGPDLVIKLAQHAWPAQLVAVADKSILEKRAKELGEQIKLLPFDSDATPEAAPAGAIYYLQVDKGAEVIAGQLDETNGHYVLETLRIASEKNMDGTFAAVVTGPCS